MLAGRLSGAKVEYGLLPLGALGLTSDTLAFAAIGPGWPGLIAIMALMGIFSGLLFVPLNALLQARRRTTAEARSSPWPTCWSTAACSRAR